MLKHAAVFFIFVHMYMKLANQRDNFCSSNVHPTVLNSNGHFQLAVVLLLLYHGCTDADWLNGVNGRESVYRQRK